jgi:hypothetical protein
MRSKELVVLGNLLGEQTLAVLMLQADDIVKLLVRVVKEARWSSRLLTLNRLYL